MQTFLPYADFDLSFRCLDYRRLGKQRVEARQMIDALEGRSKGWVNHPCTKMWRNNIDALKLYYNMCLHEWSKRGYKNNMLYMDIPDTGIQLPWWFGDKTFHSKHRAALLYKNYEFYSKYCWNEQPGIDYQWDMWVYSV